MNNKDFFSKNFYELLEVEQNSSIDLIKSNFHKLAKKYHPDVCKDADANKKFARLNEAYQTLRDTNKRNLYDLHLSENKNSNSKHKFNSDVFDVTILDSFLKKPFNKIALDNLTAKLSGDLEFLLYEYFWITFWSGSKICEKLLYNQSAHLFFKYFTSKKPVKEFSNELIKFYKNNENKIFSHNKSVYKESIENISNELKLNDSVEIYNQVINLINEDNIFDQNGTQVIATLFINETISLLELFETLFAKHKDKENIQGSNGKLSAKKVGWSTGTILTCVIIALLMIYFLN
ncbi:MAG: J domain-containing protein [Mycoplasma sp.]